MASTPGFVAKIVRRSDHPLCSHCGSKHDFPFCLFVQRASFSALSRHRFYLCSLHTIIALQLPSHLPGFAFIPITMSHQSNTAMNEGLVAHSSGQSWECVLPHGPAATCRSNARFSEGEDDRVNDEWDPTQVRRVCEALLID